MGLSAAVVVLAVAGTLLAVFYPGLSDEGVGNAVVPPAGAGGASQSTPSSSALADAPAPAVPTAAVIDECLVGTWRSVNFSKRLKIRTETFSVTGAKT